MKNLQQKGWEDMKLRLDVQMPVSHWTRWFSAKMVTTVAMLASVGIISFFLGRNSGIKEVQQSATTVQVDQQRNEVVSSDSPQTNRELTQERSTHLTAAVAAPQQSARFLHSSSHSDLGRQNLSSAQRSDRLLSYDGAAFGSASDSEMRTLRYLDQVLEHRRRASSNALFSAFSQNNPFMESGTRWNSGIEPMDPLDTVLKSALAFEEATTPTAADTVEVAADGTTPNDRVKPKARDKSFALSAYAGTTSFFDKKPGYRLGLGYRLRLSPDIRLHTGLYLTKLNFRSSTDFGGTTRGTTMDSSQSDYFYTVYNHSASSYLRAYAVRSLNIPLDVNYTLLPKLELHAGLGFYIFPHAKMVVGDTLIRNQQLYARTDYGDSLVFSGTDHSGSFSMGYLNEGLTANLAVTGRMGVAYQLSSRWILEGAYEFNLTNLFPKEDGLIEKAALDGSSYRIFGDPSTINTMSHFQLGMRYNFF